MTDALSASDKAKLYFKRATDFVAAVIASWPALAISSLCVIAFGAQSYYAPERLPPFGGLSLAHLAGRERGRPAASAGGDRRAGSVGGAWVL